MHKVDKTSSGKILVEMPSKEWKSIAAKAPELDYLSEAMVKFRFEHRLTQEALGEKLGVSRNTISNIERGIIAQGISMKMYHRIM